MLRRRSKPKPKRDPGYSNDPLEPHEWMRLRDWCQVHHVILRVNGGPVELLHAGQEHFRRLNSAQVRFLLNSRDEFSPSEIGRTIGGEMQHIPKFVPVLPESISARTEVGSIVRIDGKRSAKGNIGTRA